MAQNQDEEDSYTSQMADHERALAGEAPVPDFEEIQETIQEPAQPSTHDLARAATPPPGLLAVPVVVTEWECDPPLVV